MIIIYILIVVTWCHYGQDRLSDMRGADMETILFNFKNKMK